MFIQAGVDAIQLKSKLFRGFADSSRLSILQVLLKGPLPVGEIVERTGLSQPNVSNHLACLRDCGLVTSSQEGRFVHYTLSDPRVEQLLDLADEILVEVARGVYECVNYEKPPRARTRNPSAVRSGRPGNRAK